MDRSNGFRKLSIHFSTHDPTSHSSKLTPRCAAPRSAVSMMVGTEFVDLLVDSRTRGEHWDCGNHLGRRFAWNRPSKELSLTVHLMCSDLRRAGACSADHWV